jgi:hypothetical protein
MHQDKGGIEHIKDPREILKIFHSGQRIVITFFYEGKELEAHITSMTMLAEDTIIYEWAAANGMEGTGTMKREGAQGDQIS